MGTNPAQAPPRLPWRRAALAAGAVALLSWAAVLYPVLRHGSDVDQNLAVSICALVSSFLTTHLLARMWRDDQYADSSRAVPGRRLATAFELLLVAAVLIGLLGLPGSTVLVAVLACAALASLVAATGLAVPRS
jgi:hypothetical protein